MTIYDRTNRAREIDSDKGTTCTARPRFHALSSRDPGMRAALESTARQLGISVEELLAAHDSIGSRS